MAAETPIQCDVVTGQYTGNDLLIRNALQTLADPAKRKKLKLKPTLASLRELTELSLNTIRARPWALKGIQDLKVAAKKPTQAEVDGTKVGEEPIIDPDVVLSRKLEGLLKQNGLLYEEILFLRREVKKRDELIEKMQGGRLSMI